MRIVLIAKVLAVAGAVVVGTLSGTASAGTIKLSSYDKVRIGWKKIWVGKPPFCTSKPNDCSKRGGEYLGKKKRCTTGHKVLCRVPQYKKVPRVVRTKPGHQYKWFSIAPICDEQKARRDCSKWGGRAIATDTSGNGKKCVTGKKVLCEKSVAGEYGPRALEHQVNNFVGRMRYAAIKHAVDFGGTFASNMRFAVLQALKFFATGGAKINSTNDRWKRQKQAFPRKLRSILTPPLPRAANMRRAIKALRKAPRRGDYVVPGSMDHPIREQLSRGTCASFAAVRVMEILLRQNARIVDLSEQYFYWASKSSCQTTRCTKEGHYGSLSKNGYKHSKDQRRSDIPLEEHCKYNGKQDPSNETQIPLAKSCLRKGYARVLRYSTREMDSADIIRTLHANQPVILGTSLSKNWKNNFGFIKAEGSGKVDTGPHSAGHAYVVVGYLRLPKRMHRKEGKVCFLVANSWGDGWGIGGHACMSEKWLIKFNKNKMTTLERVRLL